MGYKRYFVAMTHDSEGYEYRGKAPAGSCIIEARGNTGKLNLTIQDLKPEAIYKLYIVFKEAGKNIGIPAGSVRVNNRGKGELKWEFDADNTCGTGLGIELFICVAVIVSNKNSLISPLVGYKDQEIQWKSNLQLTDHEPVALPISNKVIQPIQHSDVKTLDNPEAKLDNMDSEIHTVEIEEEVLEETKSKTSKLEYEQSSQEQASQNISINGNEQLAQDVKAQEQEHSTLDDSIQAQEQSTEDVSIQAQDQSTEDVSIQAQEQSTKDTSSQEDEQTKEDVSSQEDELSAQDVSIQEQEQSAQDVSIQEQEQSAQDVSAQEHEQAEEIASTQEQDQTPQDKSIHEQTQHDIQDTACGTDELNEPITVSTATEEPQNEASEFNEPIDEYLAFTHDNQRVDSNEQDNYLQHYPLSADEYIELTGVREKQESDSSNDSAYNDFHKSFKSLVEGFKKEMVELDSLMSSQEDKTEKQRHSIKPDNEMNPLERIFANNIEMKPFKKQNIEVKWVRVTIQEPSFLPIDQSLLSSPFLLEAYKQYNHLILGLAEDRTARFYILGVPGIYDYNYKAQPTRLGFTQFKCCDDISPYHGAYGYWLMSIAI